jgi:hypothetical protein
MCPGLQIEEAERRFNVERAADLRYGELPALQRRYQAHIDELRGMAAAVADSVGEREVA